MINSSDDDIMAVLDVNSNAYYTLRSRLNQKIEEYLIEQMATPRTNLIKQVGNIKDIVFYKKRTIAVTALRKLEKELLDYDLSNELTVVYKVLKQLHVNSPEYFNYSQKYNRHVAYMLATDKVEGLLAEYYKKYSEYFWGMEELKLNLTLIYDEICSISRLYESHRLYVYRSCVEVFHRLHIEDEPRESEDRESIEGIFAEVERIFEKYYLDTQYKNLTLILNFLKLQYYYKNKFYKKAEVYFEEINEQTPKLLSSYGLYTYPGYFLFIKLHKALRLRTEGSLYEENKNMFSAYLVEEDDTTQNIAYYIYRSLSCFYTDKFSEAASWCYRLMNDVNFKNFPDALLEVKLLQCMQYCLLKDHDLFTQTVNSVQRQIRLAARKRFCTCAVDD